MHALNGEGWRQAGELGLALLLWALISLEREIRQKARGYDNSAKTSAAIGYLMFPIGEEHPSAT